MIADLITTMLTIIDGASILVILAGFAYVAVMFVRGVFVYGQQSIKLIHEMTRLRRQFGAYLLFALEILIAGDIIQTIVNPTYEILIQLGGIVLIRSVIAYFLEREAAV